MSMPTVMNSMDAEPSSFEAAAPEGCRPSLERLACRMARHLQSAVGAEEPGERECRAHRHYDSRGSHP
jgi:hypothetical protein